MTMTVTKTQNSGSRRISSEPEARTQGKAFQDSVNWFRNLHFGMFIHWGPYSVLRRGEWAIQDERIPLEEYDEIARQFTASRYDPRQWVALAKEAGMRYLVLTARHGDGYCLYRSEHNPRNSFTQTPHRDLVRDFVKACREEGMGIGLYFGLSNWYEHFRRFGAYQVFSDLRQNPTHSQSWKELWQSNRAQLRELLTSYGEIDILWFDDAPLVGESFDAAGLEVMARQLQPGILINNRGRTPGDFDISEEKFERLDPMRPWEVCMPLAIRWGNHRGDNDYKSVATLIRMIRTPIIQGGNFLLNVGPYEDGTIPEKQIHLIREVGNWLRIQGESIFGCEGILAAHAEWGDWITHKNGTVYVHLDRWMGPRFCFAGLRNQVKSAVLLSNGSRVDFIQSHPDRLVFSGLPENPPDPHCNVIALEIEGTPVFDTLLKI